jgi:flagellar hook-associated protein 3 FlgL
MIRVTNTQLYRTALQSLHGARSRMQDAQAIALSGERASRPSDDPAAVARGHVLSSLLAAAESHQTNIANGIARLQRAEDGLTEGHNIVLRVKEIALAASNGTLGAQDRAAMAAEVAQLRQGLIDVINTQHLGEYVFAHVATHQAPYDATAATFSYDVDTYAAVREAAVGPSQTAEIGASGSRAFAARAAAPGSLDVPAVLADLEAELRANDVDGVRTSLDAIATAFDQILTERAAVGVRVQRLQRADEATHQARTVYTTLRGELLDADAAEAFSNLTLAETTMRAAVTVASRILGPSLLDAQ